MADSATLKLDNQKKGWKGMCVHQEAKGEQFNCPVRALARCVLHLQNNGATDKTLLSLLFHTNKQYNVCSEDIRSGLKMTATLSQYPATWGIPIERINTHSLQSGGAIAHALLGYSDTEIQKLGCWKDATFKEYIREEIACYSAGMTRDMKRNFKFVNIAGNAYHDVTSTCIEEDYNLNCAAAA